jgi:hypothetical protein
MVTQFKQRQDEAKQAKSVAKKEEIARCLQLAVQKLRRVLCSYTVVQK